MNEYDYFFPALSFMTFSSVVIGFINLFHMYIEKRVDGSRTTKVIDGKRKNLTTNEFFHKNKLLLVDCLEVI